MISFSSILLIISLLMELSNSYMHIGPPFRSLLTEEENEQLTSICGRRHKGAKTDYPWAVALLMHGQNRLGGSIISPYHILTVAHGFLQFQMGHEAHCLAASYRSIDELRHERVVVYGGKCIRGEREDIPNHPDCQHTDMQSNRIRSVLVDTAFADQGCQNGHDIAIIELENKINFTDSIAPICLPERAPRVEQILTVAGWGRSYGISGFCSCSGNVGEYDPTENKSLEDYRSLSVFNESGPMIHEAPMLINKECRRPWSDKLPKDAADFLCATSLNTTDFYAPRICHGDSGSGMEQRDERGRATLIGLTSFGTKGCPSNLLARFTRVNHYLNQICTNTGVCYTKNKRRRM